METQKRSEITFEKLANFPYSGLLRINSISLHKKIEELANTYYPIQQNIWIFYFQCEENLVPFFITKLQDGNFFIRIRNSGNILISKEKEEKNENMQFLFSLLESTEKIQSKLTQKDIEEKVIFRYGKVKKKYIQQPELTIEKGEEILSEYEKRKHQPIEITLKKYLDVAALLIVNIKKDEEFEKLNPTQIYTMNADFRRVAPFNRLDKISDLNSVSNKQLLRSVEEDRETGSHTFEILPGIELLPSTSEFYIIMVNEKAYLDYLKAIEILIKKEVSYSTDKNELEYAIKLATGEVIVEVMDIDIPNQIYPKVKWEELPAPKPRLKTRE